ncbi:MAG: putative lipoprotein YerB [Anaerolineales bacterium]|nr:putative lipoprotein YerB [Anaerolineales bacterium]
MTTISHESAGRWLFLILIILLTLTGCGSDEPPPQVASPAEPTATFAPKPTFTPAASSTQAPTATSQPADTAVLTTTPTPNLNVNPLTGLEVEDPSVLDRRPLLVRVGNDPVARGVQAGLSQAEVVYEEIMDGWGVTRHTAVYLAESPEMIRPIRSARLVNIQLAHMYQGALAHSGASDEIRYRISQSSFVDLDEFFNAEPYTYGEGDWRTRLYTTGPRLRDYLASKQLEEDIDLGVWHFDAAPPADGTPAGEIFIPYPNGAVTWRYNPSTGLYERLVDDTPSVDANNGQQIAVANVIGFYTEHRKTDIVEDSLGSTAIDIIMMGEGPIQLYRDGVMVEGVWRRDDRFGLTQFYDNAGNLLALKPGQSWIEILPINVPEYDAQIR